MIIATRVLKLRTEGSEVDIPVRIHAPERDATMNCWKVRFAIEWPGTTFEREGYGEDAVQALVLTLQMIGVLLYTSDAHEAGRLGWHEPGQGYGFPLAKTVRDLAVGYDEAFG
jgi:hypothetical protein